MTAATQNVDVPRKEGDVLALPVKAATTIFAGTLVCVDASGWAVPGADTSGLVTQGVAMEKADNAAGANGDIYVRVRTRGLFEFPFQTTAPGIGVAVYCYDDSTVAIASVTTNDIKCGIARVVGATKVWVDIEH